MRYDRKSGIFSLDADELISFSLHRTAGEAHIAHEHRISYLAPLADLRPFFGEGTPLPAAWTLPFSRDGQDYVVSVCVGVFPKNSEENAKKEDEIGAKKNGYAKNAECDPTKQESASSEGVAFFVARAVHEDPRHPSEELLRRARGELFLAAAAYFREESMTPKPAANPAAEPGSFSEKADAVRARLLLVRESDGTVAGYDEEIAARDASRFFSRVAGGFFRTATDAVARVRDRLPTLTHLPFPYPAVRESQNALMQAAFRAIRRGTRLYASAPTGTGKTAAVLYPALRALGERSVDRVFYLTPKTTTARAAADALSRFAAAGGRFRALVLAAKERLCPRRLLCRVGDDPCTAGVAGAAKEEAALAALLSMPTVPLTGREITATAVRFGVCPYELSLRYSLFSDIIICDYNYLFDPRVALRRYFDRGGDYAILVDEAHDLLDRAREIYSATLTDGDLAALAAALASRPDTAAPAADAAAFRAAFLAATDAALRDEQSYTDKDGVLHGFASSKLPPEALTEGAEALAAAVLHAAADHRIPHAARRALRDAARPLSDFAASGRYFSPRFEVFYEREGDVRRVRILCLDPAERIDRALSRGRSAVLFSATLSPLPYYRTVLGGGRSGRELTLDSPFDPDNLCVAVMDKLRTRYLVREEGKADVAAALAAMVRARVGNYFVFCPSYAYMEMLAESFRAAYPTIEIAVQKRGATLSERNAFLARFAADPRASLLGFCVTGGVFAEGIDLVGTRLVGVAVVGVSLPQPSPERDAMCAYYGELYDAGREYAYIYPGMNRVLQAAGRVIRTETDRGVLLLIDDRFRDPLYRAMIPTHWRRPRLVGNAAAVERLFREFWRGNE